MTKRPLGLAAARAAKRSKPNEAAATEERKVVSTGEGALTDLRKMLDTALTTHDAAWYRAVIHEGQRLLRALDGGDKLDEDEAGSEGLDPVVAKELAHVLTARALIGLGVLVAATDGEPAKADEPTAFADWLEAARAQVDEAEDTTSESDWVHGVLDLYSARDGAPSMARAITHLSRWLDQGDRRPPVDAVDVVLLILSLCEDDADDIALAIAERIARGYPADAETDETRRTLAEVLLARATREAERIEDEAEEADDEWTLPQTNQVVEARKRAAEGTSAFYVATPLTPLQHPRSSSVCSIQTLATTPTSSKPRCARSALCALSASDTPAAGRGAPHTGQSDR
jgi:hypothetical protein